MTITLQQVEEAGRIANESRDAYQTLRESFAKQECPLRNGDIVECCGYSHNGKMMRVERIGPPKWGGDEGWQVSGPVLKKDGTDSAHSGVFTAVEWRRVQGAAK